MGIFTHNCVGTNDVDRAGRFYDAALAPLGIRRLGNFLDQGLAYGARAAEFLVLRPLNGSRIIARSTQKNVFFVLPSGRKRSVAD